MTVSWLTLDKVAGDAAGDYTMTASGGRNITLSGSGNGRFTVRALSNSGGPEREGTLTVAGAATLIITVKQDWNTVVVGGIKYGRTNPNKPLDPYVAVVYKGNYPAGGYWTDPIMVETSPGHYTMVEEPQWIPDPDQYSGDIVIPDTVVYQGRKYIPESISAGAFNKCYSLTSVTFPNSLTSIGENAFRECRNLTSVTFPNSLESIGENAFKDCINLTSITLPNSLKSIEGYAFNRCINLTSVNVPNSVTKIGWSAFGECSSLTSAILPGSITNLQSSVFLSCSSLRTIEVGWDTPINAVWNPGSTYFEESLFHTGAAYGNISFDYANSKLIVPPGTLGLYQNALIWKRFGTIVEATLSTVPDTLSYEAGAADTTIVVASNILSWTVAGADWLTTTGAPGSGTGPFTLTIAANDSTARETKLIIASTSTPKVADTIVVTQTASLYINVSADSLFFDAYDSQDTTVTVTAYTDWTVVKDTSWIILTPASPSGSIPGTFTVRTEDNDSTAREGHITITKGDSVKTIVVTQYANPYINVSADSLFFDAFDAQDTTITVTAFSEWTVAKDTSWIILNPASPPYDDKPGTFTVRTEDNDSIVREGRITITKGDSVRTIVVTQSANPKIVLSTDSLFFGADENPAAPVNVAAYVDWTITLSEGAAWLTVDPAEGAGAGSFTVAATPNEDPEIRTALIVVASASHSDTIHVTQAALLVDVDNSLSFEVAGIHYYIHDTTVGSEVEVVAPATDAYSGKVIIPSTVIHLGKTYKVTTIGAEAFAGSDLSCLGLPLSLKSVGTDAFKGCVSLDSVEIKWTSPADAYPEGIIHAFGGVEVSEVTLMVPKGTKAIYRVARFWGLFRIEESQTPVGTAKAAEAVTVSAAAGRLYVDSPAAETVYVYSFTGKLLHTAAKATGQATFNVPAAKLLIVRGGSGWSKKVIQ
jgi:hypothetical protein